MADSEDSYKMIEGKLSEIADMQNLIQLDILNLKNEIEKIKLISPSSISDKDLSRIVELKKIADSVETFKEWDKAVEEIRSLRDRVNRLDPGRISEMPVPSDSGQLNGLSKEIEEIRTMIQEASPAGIDPKEIDDLKAEVSAMRSSMSAKPGKAMPLPPPSPELRKEIRELSAKVDSISNEQSRLSNELKKSSPSRSFAPPSGKVASNVVDILQDMEERHNELAAKVDQLYAKSRPVPRPPEQIEPGAIREMDQKFDKLLHEFEETSKELSSMRTELENVKVSKESGEFDEIRELVDNNTESIQKLSSAIEENRMPEDLKSVMGVKPDLDEIKAKVLKLEDVKETKNVEMEEEIESLRKLVLGKMGEIDKNSAIFKAAELKKTVENNADSIEGLKKIIYKEADKRVQGVEDFIIKERIRDVEKRIDILSAKQAKLSSIKPISVPLSPLPPPPSPHKYSGKDVGKLEKKIDELEKTVKDAVTRKDIEKASHGRHIKDLDKLVEIVIANREDIDKMSPEFKSLKGDFDDTRRLARDIGKPPEMISLEKRIDEIEAKLRTLHVTSPMIIE
jgi:uncharacterized coiled-coil DUF342 family protein